MRVVLDSNVLIAALISKGTSAQILEHCILNPTVLVSEVILEEVRSHLPGKFGCQPGEVRKALELLRSRLELVTPAKLDRAVCRDPEDDVILGTALSAGAACIVKIGRKSPMFQGTSLKSLSAKFDRALIFQAMILPFTILPVCLGQNHLRQNHSCLRG